MTEALALVADATAVTVSVNPKDRAEVESVLGGIVEYQSLLTGMRFLLVVVALFYLLSWLARRRVA